MKKFTWLNLRRALSFAAASLLSVAIASAGDPEFAGVMAYVEEPAIATELGLSAEQKDQLLKMLEERERDALELAAELKGLEAAERDSKLAAFAGETVKLGSAILTPPQLAQLNRIALRREGLKSLTNEQVATSLGLSAEQKAKAAELAKQLAAAQLKATESERTQAKTDVERQLSLLLSRDQRANWEKLTSAEGGEVTPAAAPMPTTKPAAPMTTVAEAGKTPMESTKPALGAAGPVEPGKVRFNFRFAPWKDVLDWFATQADLSLVLDAPPPGTFNYVDNKSYTPAEAIDLLNGVLLTKGYTLLRRERMLMVINLEDGIPPNLVAQVSPKDLDKYGEFELVSCLFQLNKMAPEDAEAEVKKLLGPQGAAVVLPKARQIYVTETAGKLRTVRAVIEAVETPSTPKDEKVVVIQLNNVTPTELMTFGRQLLGIPDNTNSTPDGSLRVAVDELGQRLLVTGKAERIERVQEIVKLLDIPPKNASAATTSTALETPQLEVYTITQADPTATLKVLQTLLSGLPDVRMEIDAKTGNLVALARPSQHATIKATIDQMQKDGRQVEVFKLRRIDPQVAVLAINKLFGGTEEGAASGAPKVDSDPTSQQLFVRGTTGQVTQVRELLQKMGESGSASSDATAAAVERTNVRLLQLNGRSAQSALEQIEQVWPTMRANRIRIVNPSERGDAGSSGIQQRGTLGEPSPERGRPRDGAERTKSLRSGERPAEEPRKQAPSADSKNKAAAKSSTLKAQFVAFGQEEPAKPADAVPAKEPGAANEETPPAEAPVQKTVPGAEIIVTVGPNGIAIASEDLDALDDFEQLLRGFADSASNGKEFTVFYLKYAKAETAAALLQELIGGGATESSGGGGGSLMGDIASSMMGDMGGGLLGGLLGGGGGGGAAVTTSGSVSIISDVRLNALFVQAKPKDLDVVEQLLKIIDREGSPEPVETVPSPRFIPVVNASAEEIANVVRQVFSGRINAAEAAGQQRQPNPEDFIRALRGGGGGGGRNSRDKKAEEVKMTVGVDTRTNSLIVSAPDYLFTQVEALVKELDVSEIPTDEVIQVVQVKRSNATTIQKSLESMLGDSIKKSGTTSSNSGRSGGNAPGGGGPGGNNGAQDQMRQRMEMFNNMQRMQQGGGGGPGGFPGGGGFGGRGGGGPGGGRGGRGGN